MLDPGLKTALALDELLSEAPFSGAPLDLFVLFSSAGARPGFPGRSESTAASMAIDRLAHARRQRSPGRTLSINWSVWPDLGTLTDGVDTRQFLGREPNGPAEAAPGPGISAAQGLAALDRMLAVECGPQIMVSPAAAEPRFDDLPPATGSGSRSRHDGGTERPPVSVGRPQTPLPSAPLADIERDLAAMWRDVLQLDEVGVREDYFELGGHSLGAVRMFGRIRSAFGVDLPLATLFEAPTIAGLAVLLRDRMAGVTPSPSGARTRHGTAVSSAASPTLLRSLVAVQPGAEGIPLFVVHGAGGNVLNVRDLARAMGRTRAVFGLQASGIDGISPPGESIEQMAQSYLDEIRVVQPRGPYLLVGYSGGGIVAFEMARRLEATGEAIGVLAFIDTFHPQMPLPQVNASTRLERLRREGMSYVRAAVGRLRKSRRDARDARRIEEHLAAGEPIPLALRELHLIRNFDRAAHRYSPSAWTGKALLFKAEEVDYYYQAGGPTYGWDNTVLGGIEIVPIPGDHDSLMAGANAERIAQRLVQVVDEVTARDQDRRE